MNRMNEMTGLNGYLTLLDSSGRAIASDNDMGRNGNAKINRFIIPATGRYEIQAKDYAGTRTGFYSLSLTINTPATPPPAPPAGQDIDPCPAPTTPTSLPTEDPVARGPENADFEQGVTELPRTTYPVNCDFSQLTQISTTSISPATLSTLIGTSTQSTANFVVPATVQTVHFQYQVGELAVGNGEYGLTVKVVGPTATTTLNMPNASLISGWHEGVVDLQSFQGQSVHLEFFASADRATFSIKDMQLKVEVPYWTSNNMGNVQLMDDVPEHNQHVRIKNQFPDRTGSETTYLTSSDVSVPADAQSLRFDYLVGNYANEDGFNIGSLTVSAVKDSVTLFL